jgi:hypothetical protein
MDNDDVEMQAPHGDTGEKPKTARVCCFAVLAVALAALLTASIIVPVQYLSVNTRYSVGIDSVSGRDPAMGLSFNLTLGVTSRSHGAQSCINPVMFAEVFYRGVQIAISDAETQPTCAGPRKTVEKHVLARAAAVPVGHALDSLAAELKQGTAVFDLKLQVPAMSFGGTGAMASWLTDCKSTRVGDPVVPCEAPDQ